MTDKIIRTGCNNLGCNNCSDIGRCKEQQYIKDSSIKNIIQAIKEKASSYHCDLSKELKDLFERIPKITRCDVVLEKQLQHKTEECEELKEEWTEDLKRLELVRELNNIAQFELQAERKKVKRLEEENKHYKQLAKHHGDMSVIYTNKSAKYRHALDEIKEFIKSQNDGFGNAVYGISKNCQDKILQIIIRSEKQ